MPISCTLIISQWKKAGRTGFVAAESAALIHSKESEITPLVMSSSAGPAYTGWTDQSFSPALRLCFALKSGL